MCQCVCFFLTSFFKKILFYFSLDGVKEEEILVHQIHPFEDLEKKEYQFDPLAVKVLAKMKETFFHTRDQRQSREATNPKSVTVRINTLFVRCVLWCS